MVSGLKKPACDLEFLYIYSLLMLLKCAINVLTQTYLVYLYKYNWCKWQKQSLRLMSLFIFTEAKQQML